MAVPDLDLSRVPRHVACIMDGNGRWAQERGLERTEGHRAGEQALFDAVEGANELGVAWFTVYGFSTENWRRPRDEVRFLVNFNRETLRRRRDQLHELNIRVRFIGRRNWRVPKGLINEMDAASELTGANTGMTFTIAFNYGGRSEIVDAVRGLIAEGVAPKAVDERAIGRHLYDPEMPDPDLVIRTSGEVRLSNFLIWQLAYSEMVFTDVLWPDFGRSDLHAAIAEYQARSRRFGAV